MKTSPSIALFAGIIVATGLALPTTTQAGVVLPNPPITWSPTTGTNISTDSDVVTTGTLVAAFNLGATGVSSTAVNGVTFAPFAVTDDDGPGTPAVGNFSLNFTNEISNNSAFGTATAPYSNLSPAYQTLLSAGVLDNNGTFTLAIHGLINGQAYLFEWWSNDAGGNFTNPSQTTTATSTNAVTIKGNAGGADGSPGQFAIGTFTANASGQEVVTFANGFRPVVNAFQLRNVSTPEPSTWAILAAGAASLLSLRRRK